MKCPFRTINTHTRKITLTTYSVEDVKEYADCYGSDCPYYCESIIQRYSAEEDKLKYDTEYDCLRVDK